MALTIEQAARRWVAALAETRLRMDQAGGVYNPQFFKRQLSPAISFLLAAQSGLVSRRLLAAHRGELGLLLDCWVSSNRHYGGSLYPRLLAIHRRLGRIRKYQC